MGTAEIRAMLATPEQHMVVATVLGDGRPHLSVVWYGFMPDERVAFTVPARSQKVANLTRDPRVTVLVEAGAVHGELRGVQIAGTAVLDDSFATKELVHRSVAARYRTKPAADLERTMASRVAVIVEPLTVVSWDHRKMPR